MFLSPCEEAAFAVSAPHEQLDILTVHSLCTHAILERIYSFEVYTMFMQKMETLLLVVCDKMLVRRHIWDSRTV